MILRVCVVIPTFNNAGTISEAVKDVLHNTPYPVLVIDDGSDTPVTNALYSWDVREALESGRVWVERFEQNRGKGGALQFAIGELARRGFTHMVTMDGDGQHFAREINKLVQLALKNPWDLIIGDRKLRSASVPEISKFGRAFSNFWVNYQTGHQIKDSQSGFRLYPLLPIQTMQFLTRKYDFEIEVLIRLIWKGINVREVEIDVHYPEGDERVSHFNKLWDNVRISTLNFILVVVSLIKTHGSPIELSLALGLGVAVGCTPFYGFHTLIAIALAFVFRLNVVIMWLGTHVSTPILAPFLILLEEKVGQYMLHPSPDTGMQTELSRWLAGSAVVSVVMGVLTMVVTFVIAWRVKNLKQRSNWSGRTRGGRLGNGFMKLVLKHGQLHHAYFLLNFIVPYFYLFAPKARAGLNEYWKLQAPQDRWWQRQMRIVTHLFRYGQVLLDRVYHGFHKNAQFKISENGVQNIVRAVEAKDGLIMLSAHLGAWDLAATLLNHDQLSDQVAVVEFRTEGLSFQEVKDSVQPSAVQSLNTNVATDAIFEIHTALRNGRCLALMGDRPLGDRFELIPFFGKLAPFDMTAFRLAAVTEKPLLFTFGFKGKADRYDFYAYPAERYQFKREESREEQCYRWALSYVQHLEALLKKYPEQWFNFYSFWSSLPTVPTGGLGAQGNNRLLEELKPPVRLKPELAPEPTTNGEL